MPNFSRDGSTTRIEGLPEFIRDLSSVEGELDKAVLARGREFGKHVVSKARAKASDNKQRAKAAKTLRVNSSARGVTVSGGGARSPFFWGAEFGAKRMTRGKKGPGMTRGEKKIYGGFGRWTGNQHTDNGWSAAPGYFLNPAINELSAVEWKAYQDDIARIAGKAFKD